MTRPFFFAVYDAVGKMDGQEYARIVNLLIDVMVTDDHIDQGRGELPLLGQFSTDLGIGDTGKRLFRFEKGEALFSHAFPYLAEVVAKILNDDDFPDVVQQSADEGIVGGSDAGLIGQVPACDGHGDGMNPEIAHIEPFIALADAEGVDDGTVTMALRMVLNPNIISAWGISLILDRKP